MSTLGELAIKLGLDTVQFQNGLKKAEYAARQTSERTQTYLKNIEKAANSLNDTNKWARLGFLGGKGISGAKAFLAKDKLKALEKVQNQMGSFGRMKSNIEQSTQSIQKYASKIDTLKEKHETLKLTKNQD